MALNRSDKKLHHILDLNDGSIYHRNFEQTVFNLMPNFPYVGNNLGVSEPSSDFSYPNEESTSAEIVELLIKKQKVIQGFTNITNNHMLPTVLKNL